MAEPGLGFGSMTDAGGWAPAQSVSKAGIDHVKSFEGFRSNAYLDPVGVPTIGYGFTKGVKLGQTMSRAQAQERLAKEIEQYERAVRQHVQVPLAQHQFDALTSLAFNIGPTALARSSLVSELNRGRYDLAAKEFDKWNKGRVRGKVTELKGLTNRRAAERAMFEKGVYDGRKSSTQASMKEGRKGKDVEALQTALNQMGYKAGPVDGHFGPQTRDAVKGLQGALGVTADGIFGPASRAALEKTAQASTFGPSPMQTAFGRNPQMAAGRFSQTPNIGRAAIPGMDKAAQPLGPSFQANFAPSAKAGVASPAALAISALTSAAPSAISGAQAKGRSAVNAQAAARGNLGFSPAGRVDQAFQDAKASPVANSRIGQAFQDARSSPVADARIDQAMQTALSPQASLGFASELASRAPPADKIGRATPGPSINQVSSPIDPDFSNVSTFDPKSALDAVANSRIGQAFSSFSPSPAQAATPQAAPKADKLGLTPSARVEQAFSAVPSAPEPFDMFSPSPAAKQNIGLTPAAPAVSMFDAVPTVASVKSKYDTKSPQQAKATPEKVMDVAIPAMAVQQAVTPQAMPAPQAVSAPQAQAQATPTPSRAPVSPVAQGFRASPEIAANKAGLPSSITGIGNLGFGTHGGWTNNASFSAINVGRSARDAAMASGMSPQQANYAAWDAFNASKPGTGWAAEVAEAQFSLDMAKANSMGSFGGGVSTGTHGGSLGFGMGDDLSSSFTDGGRSDPSNGLGGFF